MAIRAPDGANKCNTLLPDPEVNYVCNMRTSKGVSEEEFFFSKAICCAQLVITMWSKNCFNVASKFFQTCHKLVAKLPRNCPNCPK